MPSLTFALLVLLAGAVGYWLAIRLTNDGPLSAIIAVIVGVIAYMYWR